MDFTWNAIQSGQIGELDERVKALENDLKTARAWIEHLVKRIEELENGQTTGTSIEGRPEEGTWL